MRRPEHVLIVQLVKFETRQLLHGPRGLHVDMLIFIYQHWTPDGPLTVDRQINLRISKYL